ncbi:class I SAM-dependent methyltransferase [Nonomuraea sp. NPDC004702]
MTDVSTDNDIEDASALRSAMVEKIRERHQRLGVVLPAEVERALRTVPRHRFTGAAAPQAAYADDAVVTKRNERGTSMSSVSAPWLQALMLGQARLKRGSRVLEVGSGGYQAALIAEIVGPEGLVVTKDIDPFVTERAVRILAETGYQQVEVLLGDAEHIEGEGGAYDAIVVTVGSWDVPPD